MTERLTLDCVIVVDDTGCRWVWPRSGSRSAGDSLVRSTPCREVLGFLPDECATSLARVCHSLRELCHHAVLAPHRATELRKCTQLVRCCASAGAPLTLPPCVQLSLRGVASVLDAGGRPFRRPSAGHLSPQLRCWSVCAREPQGLRGQEGLNRKAGDEESGGELHSEWIYISNQ